MNFRENFRFPAPFPRFDSGDVTTFLLRKKWSWGPENEPREALTGASPPVDPET